MDFVVISSRFFDKYFVVLFNTGLKNRRKIIVFVVKILSCGKRRLII